MLNSLGQHKAAFTVLGVVFVLGLGFLYLADGEGSTSAAVSIGTETQQRLDLSEQIEQELIRELAKLRSITLNDAIFSSPEFTSLKDFSRRIDERPRGKQNPFAPF